jgi:phenylacetate-CoA ligase
MPLLRFRTGDIAIGHHEKCACGRTSMRLGPIAGRKQQMLKVKGTTIFPQGIFEWVQSSSEVQDFLLEAITNELGTDDIRLHLLVQPNDQASALKKLRELFQSRLRVVPEMIFCSRADLDKLQMQGRKLSRFADHRS